MMRFLLLLCVGLPAWAEPRFVDRSGTLPVQHVYSGGWEHFVGGGVAIFDCNDDGRPEILAAGGDTPARLFVNTTAAPGAPLTFAAGAFPAMTGVTGAYPLDIDGDARLDLAVLRVGANRVLRGMGDCRFEDATDAWGIDPGEAWTTAFTATWEPAQTRPTLVFGNYVDQSDPEGPFGACDSHRLFRPRGGTYGAPEALAPGYCTLSMLISDWQRNGTPELRISNDRHYYLRGGHEEMWRLSPLAPRDADDGWDKVSLWGMGIASADITGDGRPEVMLTSMGDQLLQLNAGDGWVNAPYSLGTYAQRPHVGDDGRPSTGWHAEFADVDNDGRLDLFIAKGNVDQMPGNAMNDPNNLLMQRADGTFAEASVAAGIATTDRARGAGLADFDGDGRLDLVVNNRRAPLELWQNVGETGEWLAVDPRMASGNRLAIGAVVEMRGPHGTQVRERTVGGGHAGGQALPLHFGLGTAKQAEVRVIWPDGTKGRWHAVRAGKVLRLEYPG